MSRSPDTTDTAALNAAPLDATIMVDARYLRGPTSGIGRYVGQVVRNCLQLDNTIRFELVTHPDNPRPIDHPRVRCQPFGAAPNSLTDSLLLTRRVDFSGADLFHAPANLLPLGEVPVPSLLTLHDVMWLRGTGYWTDQWWRELTTGTFYRTMIPRSVQAADRIVTVSRTIQQEIEEMFPEMAGRVDVTHNGVDPFFRPMAPADGWPLIGDIAPPRQPFVLVVGRGSPYKNHPGAVEAFVRAFRDQPEVDLVLVRSKVRASEPRLQELKADPAAGWRIREQRRVTGDQLRALYSLARAFLFPSFYEGFGLPIVEAMACGTPVVTSNVGAPAEVAGDAALTADPHRPGEIARALRRLVENPQLNSHYRRRGLKRAETFTWTRCARATLEAYRNLLTHG